MEINHGNAMMKYLKTKMSPTGEKLDKDQDELVKRAKSEVRHCTWIIRQNIPTISKGQIKISTLLFLKFQAAAKILNS